VTTIWIVSPEVEEMSEWRAGAYVPVRAPNRDEAKPYRLDRMHAKDS
jgi:hypothetical protein